MKPSIFSSGAHQTWTVDLGAQTTGPAWLPVKCGFPLEHIQQIFLTGVYVKGGADTQSDLIKVQFRSNGNNMQFNQQIISSIADADDAGDGIYLTIPHAANTAAFQSFPVPYPLLSGETNHGFMNRVEVRVCDFAGSLVKFARLVLHFAVVMRPVGDRPLAHRTLDDFGRRLMAEY